jgi:hypothetical protein
VSAMRRPSRCVLSCNLLHSLCVLVVLERISCTYPNQALLVCDSACQQVQTACADLFAMSCPQVLLDGLVCVWGCIPTYTYADRPTL